MAAVSVSYGDFGPNTTPSVSYQYDALGRRIGMSDGAGASTFQWDAFSRLVASTDGAGKHVGYSYDLAGRLLTIGYPPGDTVSRAYDAAGRLTSVSDFFGLTTHFTYNADGRIAQRWYPNGIATFQLYDRDSRLVLIIDPIFSEIYLRDPLGLILHRFQSLGGDDKYSYTALSQLASDQQHSFTYNAAERITRLAGTNFSYDAAAELISATSASASPVSFSYDARGERVSGSLGLSNAAYSYDGARRLSAFSGIASYAYTGDGLRAAKTVNAVTRNFVWDRAAKLPLVLDDGVNRYIYGPGGMPIEQVSGVRTSFFHTGQLGSIRGLSDASGKRSAIFSYDAYGNKSPGYPGQPTTPFGFAGQYSDVESGLIYMCARYYDPLTGLFLTRDPLVALTRQPYTYAAGDPINLGDSSGLQASGSCSTSVPDSGAPPVSRLLADLQAGGGVSSTSTNRGWPVATATASGPVTVNLGGWVYDPGTGSWTPAGQTGAVGTAMPGGPVTLNNGGWVYNPATGSWTPAGQNTTGVDTSGDFSISDSPEGY
ncbi:MAG: RHS repeat-associated core domain-containing protein [Candidatus Binataceae bacterium]